MAKIKNQRNHLSPALRVPLRTLIKLKIFLWLLRTQQLTQRRLILLVSPVLATIKLPSLENLSSQLQLERRLHSSHALRQRCHLPRPPRIFLLTLTPAICLLHAMLQPFSRLQKRFKRHNASTHLLLLLLNLLAKMNLHFSRIEQPVSNTLSYQLSARLT